MPSIFLVSFGGSLDESFNSQVLVLSLDDWLYSNSGSLSGIPVSPDGFFLTSAAGGSLELSCKSDCKLT
jgi:hypothetical protein